MMQYCPFPAQSLVDLIADGLDLAFGLSTAKDEIIGKVTYASGVEQENILRLLIRGCLRGSAS